LFDVNSQGTGNSDKEIIKAENKAENVGTAKKQKARG
jgi:hypothetical protein